MSFLPVFWIRVIETLFLPVITSEILITPSVCESPDDFSRMRSMNRAGTGQAKGFRKYTIHCCTCPAA
jgi:hypothetical protein